MGTASPGVRMAAARSWGLWAFEAGDRGSAVEGYAAAVGLLPQVAWHGLDRVTREEQLSEWSGLAAAAAGCAVAAGQPGRAVELLEQGRSVLWTQLLHTRTDLTRLAERAPDLAARLDQVRDELDRPLPDSSLIGLGDPGTGEDPAAARRVQERAVERRRQLAREWDTLIGQVRTMEGFEHFLAPTPFGELRTAALGGPVVIVNVSPAGCHALIVTGTRDPGVTAVDLPRLTYDAAVEQANALLDVLPGADDRGWHPFEPDWKPRDPDRDRSRDRNSPLDVLEWLWDTIASPVLDALGHTGPPAPGQPWPRLWWCPTGPLAVLPLHAAGRHPRGDDRPTRPTDSVPARVISSYTSTLTALLRARRTAPTGPVRQLVIGMPETPGHYPLPAVRPELDVLAGYFPPPASASHLVGHEATRRAVLDALPNHAWAHLACHGSQHSTDPSRSAFALWDGPLTVADLASVRIEHAELAFLSACQTATGSTHLLDEAIHLAAATQLLGYRHVIATLWTIADAPAPDLAAAVYAELTHTGHPDPTHAAAALHHAVHTLRETHPDQPLLWAPYIHTGP